MTSPLLAALFAPSPEGGTNPLVPFLFQIAAIMGIFYFLLIRPQQKQRKQHEERIRNVKKGDAITTAGGVIGEVIHIREGSKDGVSVQTLDDPITIKSGESRLVIERRAITRVATADAAPDKK